MRLVLLVACAADVWAPTIHPPGSRAQLHVYAPPAAHEGPAPPLFFVTGVGGEEPARDYSQLLTGLAGAGFLVLGVDHAGLPDYPRHGRELEALLRWAESGLAGSLVAAGVPATADWSRAMVMGQSAGSHLIAEALRERCVAAAKALVFLDPVDGYDPFRLVKSQDVIVPGKKLPFSVPTLLLSSGLDGSRASPLSPPCAPAELGASRWFAALPGPRWSVNATAYGHVDCMNDDTIRTLQHICKSDPNTDKNAYREFIVRTVTLFARVFTAPAELRGLAAAANFNVSVELAQDLDGQALARIQPGCQRAGGLGGRPDEAQLV